jgi:hypothetical protein
MPRPSAQHREFDARVVSGHANGRLGLVQVFAQFDAVVNGRALGCAYSVSPWAIDPTTSQQARINPDTIIDIANCYGVQQLSLQNHSRWSPTREINSNLSSSVRMLELSEPWLGYFSKCQHLPRIDTLKLYGHTFVPSEVAQLLRTVAESLLHLTIMMTGRRSRS